MNFTKRGNASRMFQDVKTLSEIGPRSVGSEGEHRAGDFVKKVFEESGFHVVEEPFMTEAFEEYSSYVEIEGKKYDTKAMFFTESTGEDGITGELVYGGTGKEEDLKDLDLEGKIVIFNRDKEEMKDQFWPEVNRMAEKGALAAILINFDDWIFITTLETGLFNAEERFKEMTPNNIPALIVDRNAGGEILRLMEDRTINGKVYIDAFKGMRESKNIRAIKKGTGLPDEKILVYGHRDSVGTPGANDNGSGTVIMMEMARLLKDVDMKRTVEIVSMGAEEQLGSMGAYNYIKEHRNELSTIKASIEMDMVGSGSPLKVMLGGNWPDIKIEYPEWLCHYVKDTAEELDYHVDLDYCVLGTPDSGRFTEAGVPTTWLWGDGDIYYHSMEDTWKRVDPNKLKAACDIALVSTYKLANDENLND